MIATRASGRHVADIMMTVTRSEAEMCAAAMEHGVHSFLELYARDKAVYDI